jgi:hypothetical protein
LVKPFQPGRDTGNRIYKGDAAFGKPAVLPQKWSLGEAERLPLRDEAGMAVNTIASQSYIRFSLSLSSFVYFFETTFVYFFKRIPWPVQHEVL